MRDTAPAVPGPCATERGAGPPLGRRLAHLALVWGAVFAVFVLLVPEQFADPFIRSDDYPAIFPLPDLFYWKTLAEGRWVNWLWMLRPWPTGPQTLWAIYIGLWTLCAALVGVGLHPRARLPFGALAVAVAFGLSPHVAMIANWFGTMIPATAILAGQAAVLVFGSARAARVALLLGIPPMLMCHTGYPFLMLALHAALCRSEGGWRETLWLLVSFTAALAASLLLIYTLNWAVHGHFGIELAGWREAKPVAGLDDLLRNLAVLRDWAAWIAEGLALTRPLVSLPLAVLLVATTFALPTADRPRMWRLWLCWLLSLGVVAAHIVQSGVAWPLRASGFLWVFPLLLLALASVRAPVLPRRLLMLVGLCGLTLIGGYYWRIGVAARAVPFQEFTRTLAYEIRAAAAPAEPRLIVILGQAHGPSATADLNDSIGLAFRLRLLTGADTFLCERQSFRGIDAEDTRPQGQQDDPRIMAFRTLVGMTDAACAPHMDALRGLAVHPLPGHVARLAPGVVGLRLPDLIRSDVPP